jgi:Ribbon-helix-helix protein, copG family
MSSGSTKLAPETAVAADLPLSDLKRLRQLMRRDGISWSEFLRRAIQAYDLMYSRSD